MLFICLPPFTCLFTFYYMLSLLGDDCLVIKLLLYSRRAYVCLSLGSQYLSMGHLTKF